jgi:hypothetical protein
MDAIWTTGRGGERERMCVTEREIPGNGCTPLFIQKETTLPQNKYTFMLGNGCTPLFIQKETTLPQNKYTFMLFKSRENTELSLYLSCSDNNYKKLQLGCHPVAAVILQVHKIYKI